MATRNPRQSYSSPSDTHTLVSVTQNGNSSRAPYEIRHGLGAVVSGNATLQKTEVYHYLRCQLEGKYLRDILWTQFSELTTVADLRLSSLRRAFDLCNKTVPVFLLPGQHGSEDTDRLAQITILNYFFRQSFRPYDTDVEYEPFLTKLLRIRDLAKAGDDASAVALGIDLHDAICNKLDGILAHTGSQHYTVHPLFRAIIIIVHENDCHSCRVIARIAHLPVLIILTGETEELSQPVTFDSIRDRSRIAKHHKTQTARTTLGVAIGFAIAMEKREHDIFGSRPDPIQSTTDPRDTRILYREEREQADRMGWSNLPLVGPSSRWVNNEEFPTWTGDGAQMRLMETNQADEFARHRMGGLGL